MKVVLNERGGAQVALSAREVALLRMALQRATFVDTPPEHQEATFELAERLLSSLEPPARAARPS